MAENEKEPNVMWCSDYQETTWMGSAETPVCVRSNRDQKVSDSTVSAEQESVL